MKNVYVARLVPIEDGGGYCGTVPDVPGCVTTGRDMSETLENIRDALSGCLCVLEDEGEPVPSPTAIELVEPDGGCLALVDVDTTAYRIKTDTRAVRKNVSMPAWMSEMADRRGINCSQLLQEALRSRLNM